MNVKLGVDHTWTVLIIDHIVTPRLKHYLDKICLNAYFFPGSSRKRITFLIFQGCPTAELICKGVPQRKWYFWLKLAFSPPKNTKQKMTNSQTLANRSCFLIWTSINNGCNFAPFSLVMMAQVIRIWQSHLVSWLPLNAFYPVADHLGVNYDV